MFRRKFKKIFGQVSGCKIESFCKEMYDAGLQKQEHSFTVRVPIAVPDKKVSEVRRKVQKYDGWVDIDNLDTVNGVLMAYGDVVIPLERSEV